MNDRGKSGIWFNDFMSVDDPYDDPDDDGDGDFDECDCEECRAFAELEREYEPMPLASQMSLLNDNIAVQPVETGSVPEPAQEREGQRQ